MALGLKLLIYWKNTLLKMLKQFVGNDSLEGIYLFSVVATTNKYKLSGIRHRLSYKPGSQKPKMGQRLAPSGGSMGEPISPVPILNAPFWNPALLPPLYKEPCD